MVAMIFFGLFLIAAVLAGRFWWVAADERWRKETYKTGYERATEQYHAVNDERNKAKAELKLAMQEIAEAKAALDKHGACTHRKCAGFPAMSLADRINDLQCQAWAMGQDQTRRLARISTQGLIHVHPANHQAPEAPPRVDQRPPVPTSRVERHVPRRHERRGASEEDRRCAGVGAAARLRAKGSGMKFHHVIGWACFNASFYLIGWLIFIAMHAKRTGDYWRGDLKTVYQNPWPIEAEPILIILLVAANLLALAIWAFNQKT